MSKSSRVNAKRLRRDQTDAEQKIWLRLRARQLSGENFRRQHPVGRYIVDFCCVEKKVIVELDGGQHAEQEQDDQQRTEYLKTQGYRVLRFWNHDALEKTDDVLEELVRAIDRSDSSHSHPSPLPGREKGQSNGFRMPAEWELHEASWVGWPHNTTDWPGKMSAIHLVYGEIVRKLSVGEIVRILVNDKKHEERAMRMLDRVGVDRSHVEFFRIPTNRGWTRDFGPIFVKNFNLQSELRIARFRFNAWANYPDWQKDNRVPERLAAKLKMPVSIVEHGGRLVVLEGGSIDVNGCGTLLTTEECLLDEQVQVRNPGFQKHDYEQIFRQILGITNVVWLGKGIAGDDTHGHVDDLCRFVNRNTVVVCQESNTQDENYETLKENRERLASVKLEDGSSVQVVHLPMPASLRFEGRRLPASYANFYIANAAVLVPTFNDPHDRVALGILGELFPDRPVVGIHAVDLVWGFGTIHCLTQQQPALTRHS
ncbi:MAG: hypothetical protein NPIRA01_09170 [Nitrospirales bacterium]|nr:MAG: hypothetical protein NPIRA01_09170 [Nitrospirales bacterium]